MIKITKEGKIKNHYIMIYNADCPMCHCEFEFTLDECSSVERRVRMSKEIEALRLRIQALEKALEEQNEQLTKENIELKKKLNKTHIMWDDLTFSKETTYIKATLNNVVVTLECWLEGKKEWCRANFNNAPCNNIVFVHHGYDDETDTQTTIFNALGFVRV